MDKKAFITELVKLADQLDSKGLQEEASELDAIIQDAQIMPMMQSDPERRFPGYHLPEWRKQQIEREEKEKLMAPPKVDTGVAATEPKIFQPAPAL